jgi:hypothetical protein
MTNKKAPFKQITIKLTTLGTILKRECSLPAYGALIDLLHEAVKDDGCIIVVEDDKTHRRYQLTKHRLIEMKDVHDVQFQ